MALTSYQEDHCHEIIHTHAAISGGANLVPIPGLGATADIGAMVSMGVALHKFFQEDIEYETKKVIEELKHKIRSNAEGDSAAITGITMGLGISGVGFLVGENIAESVIKELAIQAIKSVASKSVAKELIKFVPIIGQIVAPAISVALIEAAGWTLANSLHNLVYKNAISHLIEYCKNEDVPPYIREKIKSRLAERFNG